MNKERQKDDNNESKKITLIKIKINKIQYKRKIKVEEMTYFCYKV